MNTTKATSSSLQQSQLRLASATTTSEKHDEDDDKTADEMGSNSSSTSNNGDEATLKEDKEELIRVLAAQAKQLKQKQDKQQRCVKFLVIVVLVCGVLAAFAILVPTSSYSWSSSSAGCNKQKNPPQQQQQQGSSGTSSSSSSSTWISWKLPVDLRVQSPYGALAMNKDGSILAIGDPIYDVDSPQPGRVILLEAVVMHDDDVEYEGDEARLSYRILQVLPAPDNGYNGFGAALALSSSTTNTNSTLVVGIPRIGGEATVQVFVATENDRNWELTDEFPNQSRNDETGSWVAVSDDGSHILYSAPNYGEAAVQPQDNQDDYQPTAGAVLLWHNGEQEAFWSGGCTGDQNPERFGQTVSMSSGADGALPVVVITRAGCWTDKNYQTITIWEGDLSTNLVVPDPNEDCVMGGTGTAATVSKNGKRIVVLAACLDQQTYQTHQAIYTFEKDEASQDWVERVPDNKNVVVIDSDLPSYPMSSFAFDDDARTVVLTRSGGIVNKVPSTDLICYKWNETTVSWQKSWQKVANENDNDNNNFGFTAVALSGNGKRLATLRTTGPSENSPARVDVYNLR